MKESTASKYAKHCRRKYFWKYDMPPILIWALCIIIGTLFMTSMAFRLTFPFEKEKIEQLREGIKITQQANRNIPEDILSNIIKYNTMIKSKQKCNENFFCDFLAPDEWNNIKLLKWQEQ